MKKVIFILTILSLMSCKNDDVNGIIISETLSIHQSLKENWEMNSLIKRVLDKDVDALIKLKSFPNGGGESSYNLGYVITQIIYKLGENEFLLLVKNLPEKEQDFKGLIDVGLEYGDNNYDKIMDNNKFEEEFPKLYKFLKKI